jgi:hypothetical protein
VTRGGRPLRFLAVTLIGWTALRVAMLWPAAPTAATLIETLVPPAVATQSPLPIANGPPPAPTGIARARASHPVHREPAAPHRLAALAMDGLVRFDDPQIGAPAPVAIAQPRAFSFLMPGVRQPQHHWSIDFWLLARRGATPHDGFGGSQLGGSQAGVRLAYKLDAPHRLAAFARADTPLSGKGREVAAGLDWQPTRLPIRIIAEQRVPLDGGKAVPAAGMVGGVGPVEHHGLRLEAYGQAGIVARHGGEGFVDGAVRASRSLGQLAGLDFDLGAGVWGGAQRDAARLDLGPTLGVTLPVRHHAIRIALDWRERVACDARPGSGPTLTIGASF